MLASRMRIHDRLRFFISSVLCRLPPFSHGGLEFGKSEGKIGLLQVRRWELLGL